MSLHLLAHIYAPLSSRLLHLRSYALRSPYSLLKMPTLKQHLACIWTDGADSLEIAITWLAVKKVTRVAHLAHLGSVEEMSGFEVLSAAATHSLNEAIEARLFSLLVHCAHHAVCHICSG